MREKCDHSEPSPAIIPSDHKSAFICVKNCTFALKKQENI